MKREAVVPPGPSTAYVPLTRNYYALIDASDVAFASEGNWSALVLRSGSVYACRYIAGRFTYLHRALLASSAATVDHCNRNTLDCRRANLRPASKTENGFNAAGRSSTGFKGVTKSACGKRFTARIKLGERNAYLGTFDDAQAASMAYLDAARKHVGGFATCAMK